MEGPLVRLPCVPRGPGLSRTEHIPEPMYKNGQRSFVGLQALPCDVTSHVCQKLPTGTCYTVINHEAHLHQGDSNT